MLHYLLRRLGQMVVTLFAISVIVFAVLKMAPGDPARILLGEQADGEVYRQTVEKFGLDKPLPVQYLRMMKNLFSGELRSIYYREPIVKLITERLPATLELGLVSLIIALGVAIPAGVISAIKRNTLADYFVTFVSLVGVSIPVFYTAILVIYLFAVNLRWLPASGHQGHIWESGAARYFIMPAFAMSIASMASTARITRSSMLEVIQQDYIRTARAKGVREYGVIVAHGLRNALIPIVTNIGAMVSNIFAGAILTETIFAWPGVGRLTINAIYRRDEPLVMGCVLFLSAVFVLSNLIVDIVYSFINPQIQYE